jgi:hypothetical protein
MDKVKVFLIGASCTIFAFFTYYNYKKLFGRGDDNDGVGNENAKLKLNVVRVSHE